MPGGPGQGEFDVLGAPGPDACRAVRGVGALAEFKAQGGPGLDLLGHVVRLVGPGGTLAEGAQAEREVDEVCPLPDRLPLVVAEVADSAGGVAGLASLVALGAGVAKSDEETGFRAPQAGLVDLPGREGAAGDEQGQQDHL